MASLVEENPGLIQSFVDIKTGLFKYLSVATYSNGDRFDSVFNLNLLIYDFMADLRKYFRVTLSEICLTFALAVFMTLFRHFLTTLLIQPLARCLKLNAVNIVKFPESAWKLTYYIVICSYLFHVMVWSGQNDIVQKPYNIWNDYYSQKNVPLDIGLAFLLEFSYYLHSLYGTLYLDSWRKDSPIMLFHHLLCLLLIGFSYATRYHKVGILLMFVHDYCDVFLEFSKCQVYMKYRNGKYHRLNDIIATFSFLLFTILWFFGRLYYFPIMVIRSSSYSTMSSSVSQPLPFYLLFNVLLWFMLALNVYWFILVLKFLYKVVSGQMKDLDDIRDYDVDDKLKQGATATATAGGGDVKQCGDHHHHHRPPPPHHHHPHHHRGAGDGLNVNGVSVKSQVNGNGNPSCNGEDVKKQVSKRKCHHE